jgi:hypothetical protein
LLLDTYGADWRKGLTSASDYGQLLQKASGISALPVTSEEVERRLKTYDGASVRAFEDERETSRKQLEISRFSMEQPTLLIPATDAVYLQSSVFARSIRRDGLQQ